MDEEVKRNPWWSWTLAAVQAIVSGLTGFLVLFRGISTPHCSERCDYTLLTTITNTYLIFVAVLLIVTGVILYRRLGRRAWWVPVLSIVLVLLGALVANLFADQALLLASTVEGPYPLAFGAPGS